MHICETCGGQFDGNPRNKNRFCSRACTARYASSLTRLVKCENCRVEFQGRVAGRGARYCTVKCRNRAAYLRSGTPEIRGDRKEYYQDQRYRKYGISHQEFVAMLEQQLGMCLICEEDISENSHIDHDHKTELVRGLLCSKCNMGLGLFNDSSELLIKAADYLNQGERC